MTACGNWYSYRMQSQYVEYVESQYCDSTYRPHPATPRRQRFPDGAAFYPAPPFGSSLPEALIGRSKRSACFIDGSYEAISSMNSNVHCSLAGRRRKGQCAAVPRRAHCPTHNHPELREEAKALLRCSELCCTGCAGSAPRTRGGNA